MSLFVSLSLTCLAGVPGFALQEAAVESAPVVQETPAIVHQLPAHTLMHMEVPGLQNLQAVLEGTHIMGLIRDEEVQAFLSPILEGIHEDMDTIIESVDAGVPDELFESVPGRITFSLIDLKVMDMETEDVDAKFLLTAEMPENGAALYDFLKEKIKEESTEIKEFEIDGHPAMKIEDDEITLTMAWADSRFMFAGGEQVIEDVLAGAGQALASKQNYQEVYAKAEATADSIFVYVDWKAFMEMVQDTIKAGMSGVMGEDQAEVFVESTFGGPEIEYIDSLALNLQADGRSLRDRIVLYAPGDRSDLGKTGPVGDAPLRHAAFVDQDVDIFLTAFFDFSSWMTNVESREKRLQDLVSGMESGEGLLEDQMQFGEIFRSIEESTGLDLKNDIAPVLGNSISFAVSMPLAASLTAMPDVTVMMDLVNAEAADILLAKLTEEGREYEGMQISREDWEEHVRYEVLLPNSGLPFIPTVSRYENTLFVTLSPQAMVDAFKNIGADNRLANKKGFHKYYDESTLEARTLGWFNLAGTFEYIYGMLGVVMNVAQQSGMQMDGRFDPALLPDGERLGLYLDTGMMYLWEDEGGFVYEGVSTIGNPLTGMITGLLGGGAFVGFAEGLHQEAQSAQRESSEENLLAIAQAMETYKNSVGSGSYPESLVNLLDRGILTEPDVLIDPADPKPKRVRSGSGDRVKMSYVIAASQGLPEAIKRRVGDKSEMVVYTREAWFRSNYRLVATVPPSGNVYMISESAWVE